MTIGVTSAVWNLLRKDVLMEWRQKSAIASMMVYVISTVFVIYFAFSGNVSDLICIGLYWIILLFVVVNMTLRSFSDEAGPQFYYIRSLAKPSVLILAKQIYNAVYFSLLSCLTLFALILFLRVELEITAQFVLIAWLGAVGLANMFTLLAAMTARIQNAALIAILGFPIVIPLLLMSIRLSIRCFDPMMREGIGGEIAIVAVMDGLIILLSAILFTYLWRD